MKSQWDCFKANLGEWRGSFTQFSPDGRPLSDTPSVLRLTEQPDQSVKLALTRTPLGELPQEMVLEFRPPGPGAAVPFFETGAFAQGSPYWSHFSQSGAELALTTPDRRVRLVLLYEGLGNGTSSLKGMTLIRETQAGSGATASPPLTLEQLLGTWEGQSLSIDPDGRISEAIASQLVLQHQGDRLQQTLSFGDRTLTLTSSAKIDGPRLLFDEGPLPIQVLMLPGGASAHGPLEVRAGQSFGLEVGWMVEPNQRQRLIRRYSSSGDCESVTLVQERRIQP